MQRQQPIADLSLMSDAKRCTVGKVLKYQNGLFDQTSLTIGVAETLMKEVTREASQRLENKEDSRKEDWGMELVVFTTEKERAKRADVVAEKRWTEVTCVPLSITSHLLLVHPHSLVELSIVVDWGTVLTTEAQSAERNAVDLHGSGGGSRYRGDNGRGVETGDFWMHE